MISINKDLFDDDFSNHKETIEAKTEGVSVLIVGAGGSIGRAVALQFAKLPIRAMMLVDISENSLVETIRLIRSSADTLTFSLKASSFDFCDQDSQSRLFDESENGFDFCFNFAAVKHVRSERDFNSLARMISVNVILNDNFLKNALGVNPNCGYFFVSTDKASDPVNCMGASKLLMEQMSFASEWGMTCTSARFANVAYSNGSLLDSFYNRVREQQAIAVPADTKRYFISGIDAAKLCILASTLSVGREIFIPKTKLISLKSFVEVVSEHLNAIGFNPLFLSEGDSLSSPVADLINQGLWPVFTSSRNTTGEKELEAFSNASDDVNVERFKAMDVISAKSHELDYKEFLSEFQELIKGKTVDKRSLIKCLQQYVPNFSHEEKGIYLDERR